MSKSTQFCVLAELLTDVRTRHKTALGVQSNLLEKKELLLHTVHIILLTRKRFSYLNFGVSCYGFVLQFTFLCMNYLHLNTNYEKNTFLKSLGLIRIFFWVNKDMCDNFYYYHHLTKRSWLITMFWDLTFHAITKSVVLWYSMTVLYVFWITTK